MIELSIITSVFNGAEHVNGFSNALDNIIAKAFESGVKINVFIIDAGSTDGTVDLLKQMPFDTTIKVFPGISLPAARNLGIENTNSDYILLLDIDDQLIPNSFLKLIKKLTSNTEIYYFYAPVKYFDQIGSTYTKIASLIKLFDGMLYTPDVFERNYFVTLGSVIIKREVFQILRFDPHARLGEDWIFLIELCYGFTGKRLRFPFLKYFLASNSASTLGAKNEHEKSILQLKMSALIEKLKPDQVEYYQKRFDIYQDQFELSKSLNSLTTSKFVLVIRQHLTSHGLKNYGLLRTLKLVLKYFLINR